MGQVSDVSPGIARATLTPSPSPLPAPAESVERPPPGLARGRWEAPRWVFALVVALTVLGGLAWLLVALRTRLSQRRGS